MGESRLPGPATHSRAGASRINSAESLRRGKAAAAHATALSLSLCPKGHAENNQLLILFAYNQGSGGVRSIKPQQEFIRSSRLGRCLGSGSCAVRLRGQGGPANGEHAATAAFTRSRRESSASTMALAALCCPPRAWVFVGRGCSGRSLPTPGPEERPDRDAVSGTTGLP